jgi:transposase
VRRTRRCAPIKSELLVIGVDVAKNAHLAVAVSAEGVSSKALPVPVSQQGFEALLAFAQQQIQRMGAVGFVVALEPTGHYGTTLVAWLSARGIEVYSVQPSHTCQAKALYDGTSRKTDKKDALVIASLCRQGLCRPYRLAKGPFAQLRILSAQRQQLVQRRSQTVNRMHRHVDVLFPELLSLFPKLEAKTARHLLHNRPTPQDILACPLETLAEELTHHSRGQLGMQRAQALVQLAKTSVGLTDGTEAHTPALRQLLDELTAVLRQIRELEQQMSEQLALVPYAKLLLTIPLLGRMTLATLLGELGDLHNYRHAKQLLCMAGLDLVESSSGQQQGRHHISGKGRAYARQILYMAALRLGWKVLAEPRRRLVEERKKPANKAAVANMARLLRLMHAIVRDQRPFDPARIGRQAMPMAA